MKIDTRLGSIRGIKRIGSTTFLGIPYAAPPIAERRWKPPATAKSWSGVYDATNYPNRAYQLPFPATLNSAINPGALSEDMLYLNIYTPAPDTKARPVLIYIHGGGYSAGSANDFDPTPFARKHDVVVVSINYRFALFGFLDLSRFGSEYDGSAALGFQDQIAALRWVQDNISDYGGDPDNVTISGVSAGAGSVLALLSAPTAQGLFHKALAFSPAAMAKSPVDAVTPLAEGLKMDEATFFDYIQSLTGEALFDLQTQSGLNGLACVDGTIIVKPVAEAIKSGVSAIPLIVGSCINEGTMLTPSLADYGIENLKQIELDLTDTIGGQNAGQYSAFVDRLLPNATNEERLNRVWYDLFRAPSLRAAQATTSVGTPAWVYSFEVPTDHVFGPTHASDMPFIFNLFQSYSDMPGLDAVFHEGTPGNRQIMDMWTRTIAHFMRTGDPNWEGLPNWPTYTVKSRSTLALREQPIAIDNLDSPDALAAYGLH